MVGRAKCEVAGCLHAWLDRVPGLVYGILDRRGHAGLDVHHYVLIGDGKKENNYKYSLTSWYITRQLYPRQSPPPPPPPPPQHHYQLAGRQTLRRSGHRLSGIPILRTRHPS